MVRGSMTRCDWCIGVIRRDCTMMRRCVKSGLARSQRQPAQCDTGRDSGGEAE